LLLKCELFRYSFYSMIADVMAENAHLTYKYLTPVKTPMILINQVIDYSFK